ncbi:MAG: glycosyltransferase family 9 protein [Chloroflexi bacterium]|nr:glycosyltransferase family 9 protein [Chloroflexota bacterium]
MNAPRPPGPKVRDAAIGAASRMLSLLFALRRASPFPKDPRSILILKPCCVGDVLLATPLVAALRKQYPEAHIDFAVGPWAQAMVESNPRLNGLLDCGRVGSGGYGYREYWSLVQRIRERGYQVCFVLDRSPLISLLPFWAGTAQRVGLDSGGRGFSLTLRVPVRGVKHEADLYLDTARAIGLSVRAPRLEYYPTEVDRARAREWLAPLSGVRPLIALIPGGGVNPGGRTMGKRWPPERFARVGDRSVEELKARVVIIGGRGAEPIANELARAMHHPPLDPTGQLSWGETGAVLEICDLAIANDTGAMHLAVAVGTPVVAIFGPSDPRVYGPLDPRSIALGHGPSGPLPRSGNPRNRDMTAILRVSEEEVYQAVQVVWERVRSE